MKFIRRWGCNTLRSRKRWTSVLLKDRFLLLKNCQTICCSSIILQLSGLEFDLKVSLFPFLQILLTENVQKKNAHHRFVDQIWFYKSYESTKYCKASEPAGRASGPSWGNLRWLNVAQLHPEASVAVNSGLPPPLLSRFDVVVVYLGFYGKSF